MNKNRHIKPISDTIVVMYLYHKAKKCHFASASTVGGAEAPQVQALATKHFLAL
jgi:hypothetical protein